MTAFRHQVSPIKPEGFSLVEVVLALGVVAFAIVAILGVIPVGLSSGRSSQSETRAAQIAQDILSSLASQSQTTFSNCSIKQSATNTALNFSYNVDLTSNTGNAPYTFAADNDGHLAVIDADHPAASFPYQVVLYVAKDPAGFDSGHAALVTVRVAWQPFSENPRDFVRILTNY
jgi:uncharacterized protein (TIGR02598 family)